MTPQWFPLVVGGEFSRELRDRMHVASGAYAVRRKSSGEVVYVGESSTGNIRRTMLRHFQAPSTFAAQREVVILGDPAAYEVAVWITSHGHRPLPPKEVPGRRKPNDSKRIQGLRARGVPFTTESDQGALDAQAAWLARFIAEGHKATIANVDDGRAELQEDDDDATEPEGDLDDSFAFNPQPGSLVCRRVPTRGPRARLRVKKNPPPLGPNVSAEKLAANRTPDLFTGRTKLEEGGKGARRDWRGEAERTARELAECRRAATSVHAAPELPSLTPPLPPPPRPEGYGTTDERGQASMFKRNPGGIVDLDLRDQGLESAPSEAWPPYVLKLVESGPGHSLAAAELIGRRREVAEGLALRGLLKRLPARGRWPDRFVVTVNGSHELGTFRSDDRNFRDDAIEAGRKARASRPAVAKAAPRAPAGVETKGKHAGQLKLFNPGSPGPVGKLTELGILTELGAGRRVLVWNLRDAPVLAYDTKGRLFIVYTGKVARPSSRAELKEYARTHWGARGRGDCRNGGRAVGPFLTLGKGTTIQYTTKKGGDRKLVNYVHEWGEGGPRTFTPPTIVQHDCKACKGRCAARGSLAIAGGSYRVTERGIVG